MIKLKEYCGLRDRNYICYIYCLSILLICVGSCEAEVDFITGQINITSEQFVTKFSPKTIHYFLTADILKDPRSTKLKVEISTDLKATFHDPLLITIQQRDDTSAMELPFSFDDEPSNKSVVYRSVATSLCFNTKRLKEGQKNVSITLRTSSVQAILSSVRLTARRNLYLPFLNASESLEQEFSVEVSPTHPTYLRFEFNNDSSLHTVLLKATSKDPECTTLSIQTPFCPVFDTESNVRYQGRWQTMSTQAATTIQREGHFSTGFFVVLVVNKNDVHCGNFTLPQKNSARRKRVTLYLQRVRPLENWMYFTLAIFLPGILGLVIGFVIYLTLFCFRRYIEREMLTIATNLGGINHLARQRMNGGTKSENDIKNTETPRTLLENGKQYSSDSGLLDGNKRICSCIPHNVNIEKFRDRFSCPPIIKIDDQEAVLVESSMDYKNNEDIEDVHSLGPPPSVPHNQHGTLRRDDKFCLVSKSFQETLDSIFSETASKNSSRGIEGGNLCTSEKCIYYDCNDFYEMDIISAKNETSSFEEVSGNHIRVPSTVEMELTRKIKEKEKSFIPVRNITTLKEYFSALKNIRHENRFSKEISIAALTKVGKSEKENIQRLKRYLWNAITVAIFYAVPVYQLIIQYLMLYRSGNYDLCYYNFLCAIPYWIFVDFNHMVSNFNYIILGIIFVCIVRKKRSMHSEMVEKVTNEILHNFNIYLEESPTTKCHEKSINYEGSSAQAMKNEIKMFLNNHGISLHYEFYYTLAFVLVMEGFMSAAYHICPNQSTFQFDTCFMYVIAVMGILKIYQMRHPIYLGPSQVFLLISLFQLFIVVCLTVEQYRIRPLVHFLKGLFTLAHIIWNGYFWIHCYAVGHIKYDGNEKESCGWKLMFRQLWPIFLNAHPTRIIAPLLMLVIHSFIIKEHYFDDFANYLLFLLLGTFIGHTLCYITMKLIYGELKWWALFQCAIYFLLLGSVGPLAMQYFHAKLTQWNKTSAQSRAGNRECSFYEFYPFYDQHDIWHFLSAGAVFFYYMFLLTLDDGIAATHQSLIPVF